MATIQNTDQAYYEDSTRWGEAQFITLENVLDNILLTADDDSYFKHTDRFRARIIAKQGIKKLNVDIGVQNKAVAIDVPSSKVFPFPRYMTNWSRVSVLNSCGKLQELNINKDPYISGYLQDNNAELLFDEQGNVLEDSGLNAEYGICFKFQCDNVVPCEKEKDNFSKSWVKYNEKAGYFEFSDDLIDKTVVIEFQNAGLDDVDDCDIKINHNLEMTITYYIKWKLLEGKRNTPMSEVLYFKNEYKIEKKRSKSLLAPKISIGQILNAVNKRYLN